MKTLWEELVNMNPLPTCNLTKRLIEIQHDQRLIHLLMKLDQQSSQVKSDILGSNVPMMSDMHNASQAYRLLLQ